jgi:polyphosphate glucokinase
LNRYLQEMEKLFWPDLFIVGGGISKQSEKYLPLLEIPTPIITAQFLNQAGIVGAALAARQGVDSHQ